MKTIMLAVAAAVVATAVSAEGKKPDSYIRESRDLDADEVVGLEDITTRLASDGMALAFSATGGNGVVSQGDFPSHSADLLAMLDRNTDGGVTTADVGRQEGGSQWN